jgi:hypothetical protein
MDDDQTPAWLPLAEAAHRLGITVDALRKRARRGLVEVRKGNDGRINVLVTGQPAAGQEPDNLDEVLDLRAEVERWRSLAEERGLALARAEAQVEAARAVAVADVATARAEVEAAERIVADLKAQVAWHRLPWWRRLLG